SAVAASPARRIAPRKDPRTLLDCPVPASSSWLYSRGSPDWRRREGHSGTREWPCVCLCGQPSPAARWAGDPRGARGIAGMGERFYVNHDLSDGTIELTGDEADHLATVCRLRPGIVVYLFNGDGREYSARIEEATRRSVLLRVIESSAPERELAHWLEVACAVPKGDREQFLIEKLVELGVKRFVPLRTTHSVVIPKVERLRRYVIEASKQCGRNVLMEVTPPIHWDAYCQLTDLPPMRL